MSRQFVGLSRIILALFIFFCFSAPPAPYAGNEGDAWDQLQTLLENVKADRVKPLEDALGGSITPSQLLDGMRAIDAILGGDWKNAYENSAGFVIGLFSSTFGGYLTVHKAAREAVTAVIENWVQDLYDHPAYKGVVDVLNRTVVDSAKTKNPYLPGYLCGSHPFIQSAMQAKETRMYESWVERPEYRVEELVTGQWASRIRQETGRANMTERQVFNALLVKAVQDQKSFILTTFQRVAMKEGAIEARAALEQKARTILAQMNPPPRDVIISMEKTTLKAGEDTAALRYAYRVGDGALHSVRLIMKDAAGKKIFEKVDDKVSAKTGQRQVAVDLGKIPPHVYGKFTVELTITNSYGQSESARAFFEVVRDEAKEKERLAYVKKVAAAVQKEDGFLGIVDEQYRILMTEKRQIMDQEKLLKDKHKPSVMEAEDRKKQMEQKEQNFNLRMKAAIQSGNTPTKEAYDREVNSLQDERNKLNQYIKEKYDQYERERLPLQQRISAFNQKGLEEEKKIKDHWPHLSRYTGKELISKLRDWGISIRTLNEGLKTALAKNDLNMAEAVIQKYGVVANTALANDR